jgi:hypothetical protein
VYLPWLICKIISRKWEMFFPYVGTCFSISQYHLRYHFETCTFDRVEYVVEFGLQSSPKLIILRWYHNNSRTFDYLNISVVCWYLIFWQVTVDFSKINYCDTIYISVLWGNLWYFMISQVFINVACCILSQRLSKKSNNGEFSMRNRSLVQRAI